MGEHRYYSPAPRWRTPLLFILGMVGAAWLTTVMQPPPNSGVQPLSVKQATSQAQRFANDVLKQCNLTPSLGTQLCGEAADVAATPLHEGKDGKDGASGLNGLDGANGHNGKDGRDGSPVKAQILKHPDGTNEYCPRDGGTDMVPVFNCVNTTLVTKSSKE